MFSGVCFGKIHQSQCFARSERIDAVFGREHRRYEQDNGYDQSHNGGRNDRPERRRFEGRDHIDQYCQ